MYYMPSLWWQINLIIFGYINTNTYHYVFGVSVKVAKIQPHVEYSALFIQLSLHANVVSGNIESDTRFFLHVITRAVKLFH